MNQTNNNQNAFNPFSQAFRANEKWVHEASVIETELPNYLYSFPYERVPSISKMFDSPNR